MIALRRAILMKANPVVSLHVHRLFSGRVCSCKKDPCSSCHPPSVKKRFFRGEALRTLRTNSSKTTFEENISNFKKRLIDRGYPQTMIKNLLSDIKFTERESALLKHNNKEEKEILPFVTQYQPSVSTLKEVLMKKWNLTQNQPLLRQIFKEPRRKENP